jgi:hypothetical protein
MVSSLTIGLRVTVFDDRRIGWGSDPDFVSSDLFRFRRGGPLYREPPYRYCCRTHFVLGRRNRHNRPVRGPCNPMTSFFPPSSQAR